MEDAYPPQVESAGIPSCVPSVFRIVPIKRDANRPYAIAPRASMPYLLAEITMFFRFKNAFKSILVILSVPKYVK
jgi:hypothetical protein